MQREAGDPFTTMRWLTWRLSSASKHSGGRSSDSPRCLVSTTAPKCMEDGELMHVVLIHRYFAPDTPPYAHILHRVALRLGQDGHEVTVLTCQPSYNRFGTQRAPGREDLGPRVRVRRWRVLPDRSYGVLKVVNLVLFVTHLLGAKRKLGTVDVVMAASSPPVAVAKAGSWLARRCGASFVYHKQDIYPDVMTASGILKSPRVAALLRWLDALTERRADCVVVLSQDMARTIISRGVAKDHVRIINNFDPWPPNRLGDLNAVAASKGSASDATQRSFHVVFAGNVGRFQNVGVLNDVAALLDDDDQIMFHIMGDGALRDWLEQRVMVLGLRNVSFYGYLPPADVAEFLATKADLGIVSLAPGMIHAAYPSKTMSYLRHGCPILALIEGNSELAQRVVAAGAGMQVDPMDAPGAAATIRLAAAEMERMASMREHARALYIAEFSADHQLDAWRKLFEDLMDQGA